MPAQKKNYIVQLLVQNYHLVPSKICDNQLILTTVLYRGHFEEMKNKLKFSNGVLNINFTHFSRMKSLKNTFRDPKFGPTLKKTSYGRVKY